MTQLDPGRYAELLRKERAHDAYLFAIVGVHNRRAALQTYRPVEDELYVRGYGQALDDLSEAIIGADQLLPVEG